MYVASQHADREVWLALNNKTHVWRLLYLSLLYQLDSQVLQRVPDFLYEVKNMGLLELVLIAIGLSMDAFAVSLCQGLRMTKLRVKDTALIALFSGGFQAIMPLIGWLLGKQFENYITNVDHWIAFGLLFIIGGQMLYEASTGDACLEEDGASLHIKELFLLAIATSIDALAVGITFAFLQVTIIPAVSLIGIITFALTFAGVCIGHKFGSRLQSKAELVGGIVLIGIGVKILLEHLGVL